MTDQPTLLQILQRNLDLCEKYGNESEVMVLSKEHLEKLVRMLQDETAKCQLRSVME